MDNEVKSILVKFGVKKTDIDALRTALTQAHCVIYKSELPSISQQTLLHIDATPDENYAIRILQAYRQNCDCRWEEGTNEHETQNPLLKMMNEHCAKRATILDKAISVLQLPDKYRR